MRGKGDCDLEIATVAPPDLPDCPTYSAAPTRGLEGGVTRCSRPSAGSAAISVWALAQCLR
jgi:hypothetical protein